MAGVRVNRTNCLAVAPALVAVAIVLKRVVRVWAILKACKRLTRCGWCYPTTTVLKTLRNELQAHRSKAGIYT